MLQYRTRNSLDSTFVGYFRRMRYSIEEYKLISHAVALQWLINTSFVLPHDFLFLDIISVQVGYWTLACSRRFQLLSSMPICCRLLLSVPLLSLNYQSRHKGNFSPPSPEGTLCAFNPASGWQDQDFQVTFHHLHEYLVVNLVKDLSVNSTLLGYLTKRPTSLL